MHIPEILARNLKDDVTSTASSFKSWDTCMNNHVCKIIAIVGIVLASLIVLWLLATFICCCCMGVSCLEALCCCCCRSANTKYVEKPVQSPYANPNMYSPPPAPTYQTAPPPKAHFTNNQGYEPVSVYEQPRDQYSYGGHQQSGIYNDENPFGDDLKPRPYNGKF